MTCCSPAGPRSRLAREAGAGRPPPSRGEDPGRGAALAGAEEVQAAPPHRRTDALLHRLRVSVIQPLRLEYFLFSMVYHRNLTQNFQHHAVMIPRSPVAATPTLLSSAALEGP